MSEEEIQKIKEEYFVKGQQDGYYAGFVDGQESILEELEENKL